MAKVLKATADKGAIYLKGYPKYTKWDADLNLVPLSEIWENSAKKWADKNVIAFMGNRYTYGEIDNEISKQASRLQKLGVKRGTHVGICMANTPWYVITYQAILKIGAVVVNFNPLYTKDELTHQITDSEIEVMVTLDLKLLAGNVIPLIGTGKLKQALVCPFDIHLPGIKRVLFNIVKAKDKAKVTTSKAIHTIDSMGNDLPDVKPVKVGIDDLAVLQYTGGTTGRSKGAELLHRNISANISQAQHWFHVFKEGEDSVATFLPLFHVFAMTVCMEFTISKGGMMVMLPRFELKPAMKLFAKEKCAMFPGVPTIFQAITQLSDKDREQLSSLKIAMAGGAGLPADTKETFEKQTGKEVVEGYGLTETAPIACANPFDGNSIASCIGLPMPQTKISLRDLENPEKEVAQGDRGEVCIKGPQVMRGYWKNAKATKEAFTKDGYFRTGDVGIFDKKGFCYIVDRIKDLILCGGFNVYPRNIEDVIITHPEVAEVIVIGVPDDYRGEKPKAFVKLAEGSTLTESDLLDFTNPKLSKLEKFEDVEFRDELPKTIIGKLSKKDLREEL